MPSLAPSPASSSLFSSIVSQAMSVQSARTRLLSTIPSYETEENVDDVETVDLRSLSSSAASSTAHSQSTCESCAQLESDFAGAVLFVEKYQGPHRILTQANSSPKMNLYAYYQQATLGPCLTVTPLAGRDELEQSKWEKWRNLGQMTRQEAMKQYTLVLDNLVDDWRHSANVWSSSMESSDSSTRRQPFEADSVTSNRLKQPLHVFERLPQIYRELKELQDRVDDETKKRDELETHLLHLTRDNRDMFNEHTEFMEQTRNSLLTLVKNLENDVALQSTEMQQLALRQQQLATRAKNSVLLAVEARGRHYVVIIKALLNKRLIRAALVVFIGLRAWHFLRHHRLPPFLAQLLIHWLTKVSSMDNRNAPPLSY
ncbi:unnamed protein product [Peronospora belbahrii]|uniref:ACB domain-containing protein n=1 Tax=Peronospora belbahrii TaxID=622444 RepID=A0AAU9KNU8_9STRA|nr:unnamed protein product [Peronospora belbahrii]CAH0516831.1 unnamed protein product [Peronospora belbahrii]